MANVRDVAQYILSSLGETSGMKLQKLVYYSQAWHLVWVDKPLFCDVIEAWKDGPVCPELWKVHAQQFSVSGVGGDATKLTDRERKSIDKVIKFYGKKSAQWLSDLTHMEDPWTDARAGTKPGQRSNAVISHQSMQAYYSSL